MLIFDLMAMIICNMYVVFAIYFLW